MYKHKSNYDVQHILNRVTRGAVRYKFEVERYNVVKYKHSHFYKGSELWDTLPRQIIESTCLAEFKKNLMTVYQYFEDA